jgi:putative SOS response-associated peptidase YedK
LIYTILTTHANELMKTIHNRMPVILGPADYDRWLDPQHYDADALQAQLVPYPAEVLIASPISTYVNNVRNHGAKCLEPA